LLLTRNDIRAVLDIEECIQAVEHAFALHGNGETLPPVLAGIHVHGGGFHIKAGILEARKVFAAKLNANFPGNPARRGLPTIQGVIILCDAGNGYPLAVMDSTEITLQRTGAATAVAARLLSKESSRTAIICGCGLQGRIQLRSILKVRRLEHAYVSDIDFQSADVLAQEFSGTLSVEPIPWQDISTNAKRCDICITCTPSEKYYLTRDAVSPGTFIGAIGADNESKQELDPRLFASCKVVVDILEQSATMGDFHHALEANIVSKSDVYAELGEIVAGKKPGRSNESEIIIFDSTGMALQDVAAAAVVYEKALRANRGTFLNLNS